VGVDCSVPTVDADGILADAMRSEFGEDQPAGLRAVVTEGHPPNRSIQPPGTSLGPQIGVALMPSTRKESL
jgi:hypothetical protein